MAEKKEYIDREKAETELLNAMVGTGYQSRAIDAIHFMPTADVVEVVRCKSCEHWEKYKNAYWGYCKRVCYGNENPDTEEDDFCSCGKKARE